jgi:hypothetical protein
MLEGRSAALGGTPASPIGSASRVGGLIAPPSRLTSTESTARRPATARIPSASSGSALPPTVVWLERLVPAWLTLEACSTADGPRRAAGVSARCSLGRSLATTAAAALGRSPRRAHGRAALGRRGSEQRPRLRVVANLVEAGVDDRDVPGAVDDTVDGVEVGVAGNHLVRGEGRSMTLASAARGGGRRVHLHFVASGVGALHMGSTPQALTLSHLGEPPGSQM